MHKNDVSVLLVTLFMLLSGIYKLITYPMV
jgi:hypothetical protein